MTEPRAQAAKRDCLAAVLPVRPGPWEPRQHAEACRGGLGLLLLEGAVARRVGHRRRFGAELLGPGDVLRPWESDGTASSLPFHTTWKVIEPLRIAMLDRRFLARVAPYPEISAELVGRALQRSRSLSVNMAIAHHARVDQRLLMLLWHLAERWGRVTRDGVSIPLRLTHDLLADLIAAQRPSVTLNLQQLERDGLLERRDGAFILVGDPPREVAANNGQPQTIENTAAVA